MLQNQLANWGDKMFEDDMAKIVRRHARWAAFVLFFPLFGLDLIAFLIILWHMYSSLCHRCNTTLKKSTIVLGVVINIIVAGIVDTLLTAIPIIGWLGTSFIVYLQFYLSGKYFIETLRKLK